jgi:predicted MPP superfamily phosphohydrolase
MTFAPIFVRILERHGYEFSARLMAYIGYSWMGIIFLFFTLSLLTDLYHLFVHGTGLIFHKDMGLLIPSARIAFLVPLFLALGLALYGYFAALNIRPEMVTLRSSKIPEAIGRLRIAQVSDVHLGIIVREARLRKILRVIWEAKPDILVSTGDLVDGQIDSLAGLAEALQEIQPRYGKYAITGNHEFYAGLPQALDITRRAGFTVLRNEAVTVGGINIAGVDDPTGKYFGLSKGLPEEELLSLLPRDKFTLLLKHQPSVRINSLGLFDLQLSGHTHNGQIFPFRYLVKLFFSHITGWYDLPKGSHLYVSRGTGTWGPPIRFLSPPELTVIDLIHGR